MSKRHLLASVFLASLLLMGSLPNTAYCQSAADLLAIEEAKAQFNLPASTVRVQVIGTRAEVNDSVEALLIELYGDSSGMLEIAPSLVCETPAAFASQLQDLLEASSPPDLIISTALYFNQGPFPGVPGFDSRIAAIIGNNAETVLIQSGGDYARNHYQNRYTDTNGSRYHDFVNVEDLLRLPENLPAGKRLGFFLQWFDGSDYILRLRRLSDFQILAFSDSSSAFSEEMFYTTTAGDGALVVRMRELATVGPSKFDIFFVNQDNSLDPDLVLSDVYQEPFESIPNLGVVVHENLLTVGAVVWQSAAVIQVEDYSGLGTRNGSAVSKPDVMGPGRATAGYGATLQGTAYATAHVGAVAALLKSGKPSADASAIVNAIRGSTSHRPVLPLSGGVIVPGVVHAVEAAKALELAPSTPTNTPTSTETPTSTITPTSTDTATVTNTPSSTPTDTPEITPTPTDSPTRTLAPVERLDVRLSTSLMVAGDTVEITVETPDRGLTDALLHLIVTPLDVSSDPVQVFDVSGLEVLPAYGWTWTNPSSVVEMNDIGDPFLYLELSHGVGGSTEALITQVRMPVRAAARPGRYAVGLDEGQTQYRKVQGPYLSPQVVPAPMEIRFSHDSNLDGIVDALDLLDFRRQWHGFHTPVPTAAPSSTPE